MFHQAAERSLIGRRVDPVEIVQGKAVLAAAAALVLPKSAFDGRQIGLAGRPFGHEAGRGAVLDRAASCVVKLYVPRLHGVPSPFLAGFLPALRRLQVLVLVASYAENRRLFARGTRR